MPSGQPVVHIAAPWAVGGLANLFHALRLAGDEQQFHPHPLTQSEAHRVCHYRGLDEYYVVAAGDAVIAYGMLRGYDEGYAVPSLGIAVHPAHRGQGVGRLLMVALHDAARARGARQVRLRVEHDNLRALDLYLALGYLVSGEEDGQLVAILHLGDEQVAADDT